MLIWSPNIPIKQVALSNQVSQDTKLRHENETCDHWLDQLIIVSLSEAVRIPKQEAMRSPKAPLRWILQTKALNQRQTSLATPRYKNENSFQILSSKDNTL